MRRTKRAQIWISAVIFILVVITVMVLVLEAGVPILKKLKSKTSLVKTEDTMQNLNQHIIDIASEGQGSQRVIPLEVNDGEFVITQDQIRWKIESDQKLVEPMTYIEKGALKITTNTDVSSSEKGSSFILENSRILVNFSKIGNETSWAQMNTSKIINYAVFKATNNNVNGAFNFRIGDNENSSIGTGYTTLLDPASNTATSRIIAFVNSSQFEYKIEYTLESNADFLKIDLKDVVVK
ncbi:MAG: hypothetical protein Q8O89_08325 [Nanoarchaeota archaeon]|nr:hypothetical protein [Nanoarchaeota archaeon]